MSMIEDRLDQLQAQVQELQQQLAAATADSLAPNYLTIAQNGQVGANFSGYMSAKGLSLPEGSSGSSFSPKVVNEVQWLDSGDVIRETIQGYVTALNPIHTLELDSRADQLDQASLLLGSKVAGPAGSSSITANASDSVNGDHFATILDSNGNSNFLQLLAAQKLVLQSGLATTNLAAGWSTPYNINFPTAFTAKPVVLYAVEVALGNGATLVSQELRDVTTVGFGIDTNCSVAATPSTLHWAALGPT